MGNVKIEVLVEQVLTAMVSDDMSKHTIKLDKVIQRADVLRQGVEPPPAIWENDEDMILKLSGLV